MRLHRLRLRAFGPFADEQQIDFDPLGVGGLFLLDGPTGAGKSTVLDAITFALYGPGERGGDGRLHSHFAAADSHPQVQLEFSLRGVRHRVTRSPEYQRPKRRGTGTTTEHARVHLERFEGAPGTGRWVSRSSNKAEVGDVLADELGLTRDQFTQVVLLPQGEFMRFLRAGDDERRVLLTKLFGTELYDRITDELDRRRKDADADVAAAVHAVHRSLAAAVEAAEGDAALAVEWVQLDAAEQRLRLADVEHDLADAVIRASAARATALEALSEQRTKAEAASSAASLAARALAVQRQLDDAAAQRGAVEQARAQLAASDRAEPVRPLLAALAATDGALRHAEQSLLALAPDADEEWLAGRGADELADASVRARAGAAALGHLVEREAGAEHMRVAASELDRQVTAAARELDRLRERQAQLPQLLRDTELALRHAIESAGVLDRLRAHRADLLDRRKAAAELHKLEPRHLAAIRAQQLAFDRYAEAVDHHQRLLAARLANIAAELAQDLSDGAPCPVCGAQEHPAPALRSAAAVTADDVAAAQVDRTDAETGRAEAAQALALLDRRRDVLRARLARSDAAEHGCAESGNDAAAGIAADVAADVAADLAADLAAELAGTDQAIAAAEHRAASRPDLELARAELELESERCADARSEAELRFGALERDLLAARSALAGTAAELAEAADGHPSVAARCEHLRALAARTHDLAEAVRQTASARAERDHAQARADGEARERGFADAVAAAAAGLPPEQVHARRVLVAQWQDEQVRLNAVLTELAEAGHLAGGAGPAERAAELADLAAQQAAALAAASARADDAAVTADRAERRAARFAAASRQVAEAQAALEEIRRVTHPVVHLARLAKGMAGQRRVALTTYVLRHWFEQVLAAANIRLAGMSSGRYELVRVDEGGSRIERVGLTLQVLDRHTGEQRSARSLSGGETFYTSLALALGLADVVRAEAGGVDLDTLFIDEGFGSLDADTLDQVMTVIDELRGHGRTVGIVSHVSELKHRIAERIEVRRLPDGSSTLRVVA